MPGPQPDNACTSCGRTIARDKTQCNACAGTSDPVGDRRRAEWARAAAERDAAWVAAGSPKTPVPDHNACTSCGRTIARDQTRCNACSGTASSPADGERKRAEWARAAAERDAAWVAAGSPKTPVPDHNLCESCGRTIARDQTRCNACRGKPLSASDGKRKRAEWARAAAERDAAWKRAVGTASPEPDHNACTSCGRTIARDQSQCNACRGTSDAIGERTGAEWPHAAEQRDAAWLGGEPPAAPIVSPGPSVLDHNSCTSCGRTIARDKTRCNGCSWGASPDPSGDSKRAAWARAAAERDAEYARRHSPAERAARRRIYYLVLAGAALVITIGVLAVVLGGEDRAPAVSTVAPPIVTAPPPAPPEPPAVRIAKAATFEQAIAIARPAFSDTTDELGEGAQLLAIYATAKLRWSDVDVPAETTIGLVEKDVELGRGKRLCATGEILQITSRDLGGRKVHVGRLRTPDADELAFVAVGTTGDLVERSTGRLCGAVLGRSGSVVSILGMFDFEENRMPLVEQ